MNFAPSDVGVFAMETRSAKRPYVSNYQDRKFEPQKNQDLMTIKKVDVTASSKDKAPAKEVLPHKLSISKDK